MSADNLLSKLDGVKTTGQGRWIARCPAHEDRHASLAIRELDDGRLLLHDFAGCDTSSVLAAVGLSFDDLFPQPSPLVQHGRVRRPFNPIDILRCVANESLVVAIAASDLSKGQKLSETNYERLFVAVSRLQSAAEVANDA